MPGQPLFPCTGTLDRMPSRLVHPYPTLRFTRNNPFVLPISGSRYSREQERSICCRLVPYLHTSHFRSGTSLTLSLSLSLSLCVSFSAIRSHSLYFFSCLPFYLFFHIVLELYRLMILFGFSLVCSSGLVRDALGQFGYPWITHASWKFPGYPTRRSPRAHHRLTHSNSFFVLSVDLFWTNNLHKQRVDRA